MVLTAMSAEGTRSAWQSFVHCALGRKRHAVRLYKAPSWRMEICCGPAVCWRHGLTDNLQAGQSWSDCAKDNLFKVWDILQGASSPTYDSHWIQCEAVQTSCGRVYG